MTKTRHPHTALAARCASPATRSRALSRRTAGTALVAGWLALSMLAGCSSPTASLPTLAPTLEGPYRVGAGDRVRVAVQDLDAANGEYTIEETGAISLPFVQSVQVAGLSYREIEQAITSALLSRGIMTGQPVVNVGPVELRPFYVTGEVKQPGEFQFRQGMTVLSALSAAGGYTYRAKTDDVVITRTIDGKDVTARADETTPIQPGDRIRVYERWF